MQFDSELMQEPVVAIHPDTKMGIAALKVANLARSITFYTQIIGLEVLEQSGDERAVLGVAGKPLLYLEALPGAQRPPRASTGLYHIAILLPTRLDLARRIRHFVQVQQPFGYGDHLVSEAFYLNDPDDNGLEIYSDRPREGWRWQNGTVQMAVDAVDMESLFSELAGQDVNQATLPAGTVIGHMHLKVGDVKLAKDFYHGVLGFDVTASMPGALFVSAGGYHHHLGLNSWESRGAPPAPAIATGLKHFSIVLPSIEEQTRLAQRLETAGVPYTLDDGMLVTHDPWQNELWLVVEPLGSNA